jgi:hypothetical protein
VYLGCSWTWVIGMFLPVLLVRDYGFWGWVAFAVPNVIGAAAMGFILASPQRSLAVVARHEPACRWFSRITIAYHLLMLPWLAGLFGFDAAWLGVLAVVFAGGVFAATQVGAVRGAAVAALAVSLVVFTDFSSDRAFMAGLGPDTTARLSTVDLLLFVPASVTGFALCPYLDLTFHHARQRTAPATGRAAFAFGFGVVFFAMIVLSLAYAHLAAIQLAAPQADWVVPSMLSLHVVVQAALTLGLHAHVMRRPGARAASRAAWIVGGIGLLVLAALFQWRPEAMHHLFGYRELPYRLILLAYGLVFPGYVWLCMIPYRHEPTPTAKRVGFAVAVVVALPFGAAGFAFDQSWAIPVAVGVLVLARGILMATARPGGAATTAIPETTP